MKSYKILALLLCLLMVVPSVSACSQDDPEDKSNESQSDNVVLFQKQEKINRFYTKNATKAHCFPVLIMA